MSQLRCCSLQKLQCWAVWYEDGVKHLHATLTAQIVLLKRILILVYGFRRRRWWFGDRES